jgi:Domain of unknown function (DUF4406)
MLWITIRNSWSDWLTKYIYVAGPYSSDSKEGVYANVCKATEIGAELMKFGYAVYIPHHSYYTDLYLMETADFWYNYDYLWLDKCDALYYIGSSRGADAELEYAGARGIQILYNMDEARQWATKNLV